MQFLQTEYAHMHIIRNALNPKTTEGIEYVGNESKVFNGIEGFIYQVRVPVWRFLFTSGGQL